MLVQLLHPENKLLILRLSSGQDTIGGQRSVGTGRICRAGRGREEYEGSRLTERVGPEG